MGTPFPRKKINKNETPKGQTKGDGTPCKKRMEPLPGRLFVDDLGLDDVDKNVLTAMRFFCTSYTHPPSQAWEVAFDETVRAFGHASGPVIAYSIINLLRTLKHARTTVFKFTNPTCPCCREEITDMEMRAIKTIQALRHGDPMAAQTQAMMLCEGVAGQSLIEACTALVVLLPPPETSKPKKRMRFL
ncbi:MAG: hypothetical protein AAGE61_03495 [Pseudomonadota bacterium]